MAVLRAEAWHARAVTESLERLGTSVHGLDKATAQERLCTYGPNQLPDPEPIRPWRILARQFKSFVLLLLIAAASFTVLVGEWFDAVAILTLVGLNIAIGFYQEFKAERAIRALRQLSAPTAKVRRNGVVSITPASELVPGDIVILEQGDLIPADGRFLMTTSCACNEAPLTGESMPVDKRTESLHLSEAPLAERSNMAYMGTSVVRGYAELVIVATGVHSEFGKIATLLHTSYETRKSPLQQGIDRLSRALGWASLGLVVVVFGLGLLRANASVDLLILAVSIAVAAVPEGLPAIVTVALSVGMRAMAKRNALVRNLQAIETLGTATVICTDKTGTLTRGEMSVREVLPADRVLSASSTGSASVTDLLRTFAGCATASETIGNGGVKFIGDPTEVALLEAARAHGIQMSEIEAEAPRALVIPFDSDRKMMTVVRTSQFGILVLVKGAPDVLLERSSQVSTATGERPLTSDDKTRIREELDKLAQQGYRVIGGAQRTVSSLDPKDIDEHLVFLGVAALADPPRPEVSVMIQRCQNAGIRLLMITGDHPATARAVAKEVGIANAENVLTGAELDRMNEEDFERALASSSVVARVTAEHKLRIVKALQRNGEIIAMTGDGVNDAPALKGADIGLAMGITGTDVTKESSDIVIMDDDFSTIARAVEYGRSIYSNIRKALLYLLTGNFTELTLMGLAFLFADPAPLAAVQLLWINLMTDGLPGVMLAAEGVLPDSMTRPPRRKGEPLADAAFLKTMLTVGSLNAIVLFAFYHVTLPLWGEAQAASAVFTLLVFSELLRSLANRHPLLRAWQMSEPSGRGLYLVVAGSMAMQAVVLSIPAVREVFGITSLDPMQIAIIAVATLIPYLIHEASKPAHPKRTAAHRVP